MERLKAKQIRKIAREDLKGNWIKSILVVLLYVIAIGINGVIARYLSDIASDIITLVILFPLSLGLISFFIRQTYKDTHFCAVFSTFNKKQWLRAIGVQVVFAIGAIISCIPLAIVSIIGVVLLVEQLFTGIEEIISNTSLGIFPSLGILAFVIATILSFIPIILYTYCYSMVGFVFVDESNGINKIFASFKESRRIMKGNKWRLFCFQISYIGWAILCIISLGIGYIWFAPYMTQGLAVFYNEIRGVEIEKEELEYLI
ncbi:MAG: DUF975 family protein [Sarcina sp.]